MQFQKDKNSSELAFFTRRVKLALFAVLCSCFPFLLHSQEITLYEACMRGDNKSKVVNCRNALERHGANRSVYLELGEALDKLKDYREAVSVYEEALTHYPEDKRLSGRLSIARSNLKEQEWLQRRKSNAEKKSASGTKTVSSVQAKLAAIRCTRLSGAAALKACDTALQVSPNDSTLLKAKGDILVVLDRLGEAENTFAQVLKQDPADQVAKQRLSEIKEMQRSVGGKGAAQAKLAQEQAAREKAAREKQLAEEKAAREKAAREKQLAEEKAAREKAAREKQLAEEKAAREKAAREKQLAEEKAAREKAAREKQLAEEKAAREKAAREKQLAEEKAARERIAREERVAAEKAASEKIAAIAGNNESIPSQLKAPDAHQALLTGEQEAFVNNFRLLVSLRAQGLISEQEFDRRKALLLDAKFRVGSKVADGSQQPDAADQASKKDLLKGLEFGKYYALVIGNNSYKHLPDLDTAMDDATAIGKLLEEDYGFEVKLLTNASRYDILKSMGEFRRKLSKNDNFLIYYAGHGILDKRAERGYWLPVDAEQSFKANWISTTEVSDSLKALESWHVMVVADSCYSGTLVRGSGLTTNSLDHKKSLIKRLLAKKSRTVLTSGGLEPVVDSGGEGHSVFARAFLDVLTENDSVMEGQGLFSALRRKVVLNADQTPEYSDIRQAGHDGGDFIFVKR